MFNERIVFYKDDETLVQLEQLYDGNTDQTFVFFHFNVETFNKRIYKKLKEIFDCMKTAVWLEGYDHIFTYTQDEGMSKMVKLFKGGDFAGEYFGQKVYVWEL